VIVWAHVLGSWLMRYVPVGIAHRLVGWFTPLALAFAPGFVRRASANMAQVLGRAVDDPAVKRMTTAAFANYARYMVDIIRLPNIERAELLTGVEIRGWENVDKAFAHGKGIIFATGHIGSWDMAGATFAAQGFRVSVLVETLQPPAWNRRVQGIRERVGMRAIPIESGVRDMLAALRRNEALAILVDRPVRGDEGVEVSFFGRTARVPRGAASLALRTGAAIIPMAFLRHPSGRGYLAELGEPILPASVGSLDTLAQSVVSWLEDLIRRHPDQWYMFRLMWPDSAGARS
jgi:KDO2-lipid IV(A) lauroyltransferase